MGAVAATSVLASRTWAADIPAITLDGNETTLSKADIKSFGESLSGLVLRPEHPGYDIARELWNKYWNRRPALIAKCNGVDDVVAAVNFGREHNLITAVRCGGHSMSGKSMCDGGLVIDMTPMNAVNVDVKNRVASLEGGCLLGDMDRATQPFGLGTTAGVVSHTGAAGLILGGGMGRLQRRFGLSIDNNIGVEIVTADGKVQQANAKENQDLYWGGRGGGGNFGVVTKIHMQLHPMAQTVLNFFMVYPWERAKDAMKLYFDLTDGAPEDLMVLGGASLDTDGTGSAYISGNFFGPFNEIDDRLKIVRAYGNATLDRVYPMKYIDVQRSVDDGVNEPGLRRYAKGGFLREVTDDLIMTMIDGMEPLPTRRIGVGLLPMDGAVSRVSPTDTVWAHRDASHNIDTTSSWSVDDPELEAQHIAWNRAYWTKVEPFTGGGFYVNSLMDESQNQINDNYRQNYDRMVTVKNAYDPDNFFRLNANVRPTAKG